MSDMLEAALAYAKRGWPVFPCRADKTPHTEHGVLDATTDPARLREWWAAWPGANIAVAAGDAGLLVLDRDPGGEWDEVDRALGEALPGTHLSARTPRGGEHRYYALPRGAEPVASSASRIAAHIDVRSFHGYVLLPPSRTAAGAYEWLEEGKPATAPAALLDACRAGRDKDPRRDEWLVEADLPENVDTAIAWLREKARPAVQGNGGDNSTYAAAAMMKSYGLSEPRALEALWEHWNNRCSPPWGYEELEGKVVNAYRYNSSPPGNLTPAYRVASVALAFKPRVEARGAGQEASAGRFRFVDRHGIEAIPAPKWLIPDFLVEGGFGLLVGQRSSLKTFLALDAALTVATGGRHPWEPEEWTGAFDPPDAARDVLYVAGEGRPGLRQRIRAWEKLHWGGRFADRVVLGDPVPRVLDGGDPLQQFIDGALRLRPNGYGLVVLDTLGRAMQGVNENAQEHASAFTALVERLQRELGAAVLALHHSGVGDEGRARGSSVFEADADLVVIAGRKSVQDKFVKLAMTKQKDAPEWERPRWAEAVEIRLGMDETSLATRRAKPPAEQAEAAGRAKLAMEAVDARALEVLRAHPMLEMTDATFAVKLAAWRPEGGETLGIGEQAVRKNWLPRLRAEDCSVREHYDVGKGRWRYHPPATKED